MYKYHYTYLLHSSPTLISYTYLLHSSPILIAYTCLSQPPTLCIALPITFKMQFGLVAVLALLGVASATGPVWTDEELAHDLKDVPPLPPPKEEVKVVKVISLYLIPFPFPLSSFLPFSRHLLSNFNPLIHGCIYRRHGKSTGQNVTSQVSASVIFAIQSGAMRRYLTGLLADTSESSYSFYFSFIYVHILKVYCRFVSGRCRIIALSIITPDWLFSLHSKGKIVPIVTQRGTSSL